MPKIGQCKAGDPIIPNSSQKMVKAAPPTKSQLYEKLGQKLDEAVAAATGGETMIPESHSLEARKAPVKPKSVCPALAQDPNLIQRIQRDIAAVGLVGEEENALLIYLVYTSRLLPEPGAIVTRGTSSGGKSTLLEKVACLFPAETKIEAMTMTQASLFNTPEDYLRNKILICGERKHAQDDNTRDANAILRQLLSERRINRGVSVYDQETRGWTTEYKVREGPVAYAESTTAGSIFEEDLNRMLQVYVDTSEQQTRAVMRATASRYDPGKPKVEIAPIIDRHHELQTMLRPCDVRIPYWKSLAEGIPAKMVEARRIIQQVLTVIEAIVVLHQHQRQEQDGRLLATLEDYAVARRLLLAPVHAAVGVGKDYKNAERLKAKVTKAIFTAKDVKEAMGYKSDMGPSFLLNALVKAGLIVRLTQHQGRTGATYKWGAEVESMVLPTVDSLRRCLIT